MRSTPVFTLLLALAMGPIAPGQRTYDGIPLEWTGSVEPMTDSLWTPEAYLPGLSIDLLGANANEALQLLDKDLRIMGGRLRGRNPGRAEGVVLEGITGAPVDLQVRSGEDRHGDSWLTLAFSRGGIPLDPADPALVKAVRNLSVRLNRQVVEGQIRDLERRRDREEDRAEAAKAWEQRLLKQQERARRDLERLVVRQGRQQRTIANAQRSLSRAERDLRNARNDRAQRRVANRRRQLAAEKRELGRLTRREAREQTDLRKIARDLEAAREAQRTHSGTLQRKSDALALLQQKLEAIR